MDSVPCLLLALDGFDCFVVVHARLLNDFVEVFGGHFVPEALSVKEV